MPGREQVIVHSSPQPSEIGMVKSGFFAEGVPLPKIAQEKERRFATAKRKEELAVQRETKRKSIFQQFKAEEPDVVTKERTFGVVREGASLFLPLGQAGRPITTEETLVTEDRDVVLVREPSVPIRQRFGGIVQRSQDYFAKVKQSQEDRPTKFKTKRVIPVYDPIKQYGRFRAGERVVETVVSEYIKPPLSGGIKILESRAEVYQLILPREYTHPIKETTRRLEISSDPEAQAFTITAVTLPIAGALPKLAIAGSLGLTGYEAYRTIKDPSLEQFTRLGVASLPASILLFRGGKLSGKLYPEKYPPELKAIYKSLSKEDQASLLRKVKIVKWATKTEQVAEREVPFSAIKDITPKEEKVLVSFFQKYKPEIYGSLGVRAQLKVKGPSGDVDTAWNFYQKRFQAKAKRELFSALKLADPEADFRLRAGIEKLDPATGKYEHFVEFKPTARLEAFSKYEAPVYTPEGQPVITAREQIWRNLVGTYQRGIAEAKKQGLPKKMYKDPEFNKDFRRWLELTSQAIEKRKQATEQKVLFKGLAERKDIITKKEWEIETKGVSDIKVPKLIESIKPFAVRDITSYISFGTKGQYGIGGGVSPYKLKYPYLPGVRGLGFVFLRFKDDKQREPSPIPYEIGRAEITGYTPVKPPTYPTIQEYTTAQAYPKPQQPYYPIITPTSYPPVTPPKYPPVTKPPGYPPVTPPKYPPVTKPPGYPPFKPTITPVITPPDIPQLIEEELKRKKKKKRKKKLKKKIKEELFYIPDFTARIVGVERQITLSVAKKLLKTEFTGLGVRPSVRIGKRNTRPRMPKIPRAVQPIRIDSRGNIRRKR